jgi:putative ABC transport system permease protein
VYQDQKNFFPNFAIDPEPYFAMYPEYIVPPEQMEAFLRDVSGCIVGRATADRFGWKLGDTVPLESFIPPYRKGSPFEFVIRGIYDSDEAKNPGTNVTLMFFHFRYVYEALGRRIGSGSFNVEISDPSQAGVVSRAIDALFENSDAQTKTETEGAFRAGFISLAGNLAFLLHSIGLAVTFTILLVTANTMSMAVRERQKEIAVLKTLGFSSERILGMVLGESVLLGVLGGGVGIVLGGWVVNGLPRAPVVGSFFSGFPNFRLSVTTAALAFGLAVTLGLLAGIVPALLAYRSRVTTMLRQV